MSTKEFDENAARAAFAMIGASRFGVAYAACYLGPALDALSAARKERDEARAEVAGRFEGVLLQWIGDARGCESLGLGEILNIAEKVVRSNADEFRRAPAPAPKPNLIRKWKAEDVADELASVNAHVDTILERLESLAERVKAIEERIGGKDGQG